MGDNSRTQVIQLDECYYGDGTEPKTWNKTRNKTKKQFFDSGMIEVTETGYYCNCARSNADIAPYRLVRANYDGQCTECYHYAVYMRAPKA